MPFVADLDLPLVDKAKFPAETVSIVENQPSGEKQTKTS